MSLSLPHIFTEKWPISLLIKTRLHLFCTSKTERTCLQELHFVFESNMNIHNRQRVALNIYFFLSGVCFASWASRIPTIKDFFNFNDAVLGSVLFAMPVGSIVGLPISGWLVSKFDSRVPLIFSFILFCICLVIIGFVQTPFVLIICLIVFSFCMRIIVISINTQSLAIQKNFQKRIVGSFHAVWSTGGVLGILITTLMIRLDISMQTHLLAVAIITILVSLITYKYTIRNDKSLTGNKIIFGKPDLFILYLGVIIFFSALVEGGMYDWSGIYFKEVINEDIFTFGYLIFMSCMAFSRFFTDKLVEVLGMFKTYVLSAILIASGISLAILFPYFWTALIGFCLVGFGTSPIFPMTYLLAGNSKKYSPGMAISIISTFSIVGMLLGPPFIGYLSHAIGLRLAFIVFIIAGLMYIPISKHFFNLDQNKSS